MSELTLAAARAACDAALDHATAAGTNVSVAIVDDAGRDVFLARADGAMWLTCDLARRKAVTASAFRAPSQAIGGNSDQTWFPALLEAGVWPGAGGVPIVADGVVLGGIGVSGASEEGDRLAAEAGATVVAERSMTPTAEEEV